MTPIPIEGIYIKSVYYFYSAKEGEMSKRQKSFFKFTAIIPWIVMICIVFSLQMQCENEEQGKPAHEALSAEKILQMENEFDNYLQKLFETLKGHFEKGEFKEMAQELSNRAEKINLYNLKGAKLDSAEAIEEFWRIQKEERKVTELDFTVLTLRVIPIAEPEEQKDPDDTLIARGHAVFMYRLLKQSDKGVTNQIGSGTYDAPHPRKCIWD
jgi:hypothetical protein